ncbi:MAG: hypothetical protein ACREI8_01100, partial [Myxococcota bacterium]
DPNVATADLAAARAAGSAAGADWVLFGSFTRFGEGASLDILCVPVAAPGNPGPRSVFVQSGQIAELIPRLDGLTERVALHVNGRDGAAVNASGAGRSEIEELRRRIEALERRDGAAPAAPPPAQPTEGNAAQDVR